MNRVDPAAISDTQPRPVAELTGLAPGRVSDWLAWACRELAAHSDSVRADAEILLAALLGVTRSGLATRADDALEAATVLRYSAWIERRKQGEPVAYITGHQGFWTLDLVVDSSVLIPRPDTETLVEWALHLVRYAPRPQGHSACAIADLGTGSGAIALALARELVSVRILATDLSAMALAVARENAALLGLDAIEFREGSWLAPLAGERYDLIVSNPPYIAESDRHLALLRYEPRLALTAGVDGLAALQVIARSAAAHLHPGGWLMMEHGAGQGEAVRAMLRSRGFVNVETRRDFGGNERVSAGRVGALAEYVSPPTCARQGTAGPGLTEKGQACTTDGRKRAAEK